jgi:membrane protein implicated in regulation of membrane protease activity
VADLLSSISALAVFLGIAALGLLFLVVSLVFGELFDNFGLHGDGDIDGHGIVDTRSVAVFVTAFGGFGAIGVQSGLGVVASSLVGLGSGVVLGGAVALFGRFLYSQQATSSVSGTQLVGRTAHVTVTIPPGGVGQVACRVGEERVEKLARTRESVELKTGSRVMIEEFAGDSVIVSPAGNGHQHTPLIQG